MLHRVATNVVLLVVFVTVHNASAREPHRLRVLSYNIHHGEGVDGKLDLDRIAAVIREAEPDVVALQEVDRRARRTGSVDQPAELGRLTGMRAIFERNIPLEGGEYGNAVLTRLPVISHKNHPLPSHYDGEQRGVLAVELELAENGPRCVFLATHLDYRPDDAERRASAAMINKLVATQAEMPALLTGDLNARPDTPVLKDFSAEWTRANKELLPTFPSRQPVRQIDYVLYRPANRWRVIETRVIDESLASDHRPLLAVLELISRE
ncbi:MAG: endonuclease/exonuclease/phosphatase family protein [Pirellulales bacterium]